MKQRESRLKKLERGLNVNDEPLCIIIETLIAGKPKKPRDIREVVINEDGSETITEKGQD